MRSPGTISKHHVASGLLIYLLAGSDIVAAGIFSASLPVALIVALALSGWRIPMTGIALVLPMCAFVVVGIGASLNNLPYEALKDIWYVVKSIVAVLMAYIIMPQVGDLRRFLRAVVGAAVVVSLVYLAEFVRAPALLSATLRETMVTTGGGYILAAVGTGIMLGIPRRSTLSVAPRLGSWVLVTSVCLIAMWLSWSRTQWLLVLLVTVFLRGWADRSARLAVVALVGALVAFALVRVVSVSETFGPSTTLLDKVAYSLKEISAPDFSDKVEIIRSFRGYEVYRGIQAFMKASPWEQLGGQGFGSSIDLGFQVQLAGVEHTHIQWLHNGYIYALLKAGILGLILYLWFLFKPLRIAYPLRSENHSDARCARRLLASIGFGLLYTSLVFGGFFTKSYLLPLLFLIGSLCAYLSIESRHEARYRSMSVRAREYRGVSV